MNKFKKIMLGALSILTLGLFVVTGTKVNAETNYTVKASDIFSGKTPTSFNDGVQENKQKPTTTSFYNGIITTDLSTGTNEFYETIYDSSTESNLVSAVSKSSTHCDYTVTSTSAVLRITGGRTFTFNLPNNDDTASVTFVALYYTGSYKKCIRKVDKNGKKLFYSQKDANTAGDEDTFSKPYSTNTDASKYFDISTLFTFTVTGLSDGDALYFENGLGLVEMTLSVTSSDTTLSKIEISNNSTVADVGDAIPTTSDMTVTATYSNNTTDDVSADSTITVKNSSNEPISGTYPSVGAYTVTASYTYKGKTETASYNVTVSAIETFTVTYFDLNGDEQTKEVGKNKTFDIELNPTGIAKKFVGWSKTNGGSALSDLTITEDVTLYPVYAELTSVTKGTEKNFTSDFSALEGTTDKYNSDNTLYVYSSSSGITFESSSLKLGTNGSSSNNYVAFKIPANTVARVSLKLKLGGSNSTLVKVLCGEIEQSIDMGNTKNAVKTKQIVVKNSTENATMVKIYRASGSGVYIQDLKVLADTMVSTFGVQYDTQNPANATKIRFIATLEGIADVTTIDSVTFSIKVTTTPETEAREFKCTKLYSSLSNKYTELDSATGRYYAVYAFTDIQDAITNKAVFETLSVTITFTAESGLNPITASHAGFTIGTTGA